MENNLKGIKRYSVKLVMENEIGYEGIIDKKITSPDLIHKIAIEGLELHLETVESFWVFTLDTKNKINGAFEISRGTLNASIVHPRDVFQRAILQNSNSIMLMHNHPSGDTNPSNEDISITNRLVEGGKLLGIKVLDHIIIGGEYEYLSFMGKGLI